MFPSHKGASMLLSAARTVQRQRVTSSVRFHGASFQAPNTRTLTVVARQCIPLRDPWFLRGVVRLRRGTTTTPRRSLKSPEERQILRAERKERSRQNMAARRVDGDKAGGQAGKRTAAQQAQITRWILFGAVVVPVPFFLWAVYDSSSPPYRLLDYLGVVGQFNAVIDDWSRPVKKKLLPDWNEMPNVPHDIKVPHTLVLDLESTLIASTWDRKNGWRHAKRPGVDKFLFTLKDYYEIVIFSSTLQGFAEPVVMSLDKHRCCLHYLYREHTHFKKGAFMKDLSALNRDTKRMVLIDDDETVAAMNPENLILVKPYTDPHDREDTTLVRTLPLLLEIARSGCDDVPAALDDLAESAKGDRDSAALVDEFERRGGPTDLDNTFQNPEEKGKPVTMLTAKDIVKGQDGEAAAPAGGGGFAEWWKRQKQEQQEQHMRKIEKWNAVMAKKQEEKKKRQQQAES